MKYEIEDVGKFKMIHVIGNFDVEISTKILDGEISVLIRKGCHHFVFNLKRTTFLNSAGIGLFIHCLCDVQENNGSIYLIAEDTQIKQILEMVGITRLIKTYNSQMEFIDAQNIPQD